MSVETAAKVLPHVNASLNALATLLLIIGYALIKRRRETAHKWTMLACFAVSVLFLISYLTRMLLGGPTSFPNYPPLHVRYFYLALLASHVILAMSVPILAPLTIYHGLRDHRERHLRVARITFPIWFYVSVTGVLVYLMLYQIYPPR